VTFQFQREKDEEETARDEKCMGETNGTKKKVVVVESDEILTR
jgi:hypothetical protein